MLGPRGSRLLSNLDVPLEDPGTQGMNFSSGFRAAREAQKMAKPTSVAELSKIGQSRWELYPWCKLRRTIWSL